MCILGRQVERGECKMGKRIGKSQGRWRKTGKKNLSTFDISRLLGVDPGSVANWIDAGMLKAHRTPGGHRRVAVEDLIKFLRHHNIPTPKALETAWVCLVVIDHNPTYLDEMSRIVLERHPECEIIRPADAFQAGFAVVDHKPDLIILDLEMPGMDAFEACRIIKSHEELRDAEIFAVADHCTKNDSQRILQSGARMCISKPINPSELIEVMESAIKK